MIKKIALIETKAPNFNVYSGMKIPRLGLPIIATLLKKHGYDVTVYNENFSNVKLKDLLQYDLIGFSTLISTTIEAYKTSEILRKKGKITAIGGPHVTFTADEALDHCDFVFRGEGDFSFLEFLKAFNSNKDFSSISGLSYMVGSKKIHNKIDAFSKDIDNLPIPDFTLIKNHHKMSSMPIQTSRGCPFDCNFCSVTKMYGKCYRTQSIPKIIQTLKKYKNKDVFFVDDNFTALKDRTKDLLKEMIKQDVIPREWYAQTRVDISEDKELLELMQKTRCKYVYIGFESINPDSLKEMNKAQTVDDIREAIKTLHEYGIKVHGMFIFGVDSDTQETFQKTAEFAKKNDIDSVQFIVLTPFPGTHQYDKLAKENRIITTDWDLYDGHHVVFEPKNMSAYQLQLESIKAMLEFYSVPSVLSQLLFLKWLNSAVRFYGYRICNKWKRARMNKRYCKVLKQLSKFEKRKGKFLDQLDTIKTQYVDAAGDPHKLEKKIQHQSTSPEISIKLEALYSNAYSNLVRSYTKFKTKMSKKRHAAIYKKFKLWEKKQLRHISEKRPFKFFVKKHTTKA